MNVIFISVDSLSRHWLKHYGRTVELDVDTPNLDRFAQRATTFDTHYAGSLPCMPARREFFAGVQEFLWRPWGPMEPYDLPLPLAARKAGAVTQLITDHFHFFQHGSHGYYEDYHGFEFIRGHEYDAWKTAPKDPDPVLLKQIKVDDPHGLSFMDRTVYARNVHGLKNEEDFFAPKVFTQVADWLKDNQAHDKWLLVADSFDIHEPFHCPEPYASMFTDEDLNDPELVNWPYYGRIDQGQSQLSERQVAFVRALYAGKLVMVDRYLGKVLDRLDELNLWNDTMVIVTTDHGHYLGEHGWMGKPGAPMYNTLAYTPLFIWHPQSPLKGQRVSALTSAVDLYATMLEALAAEVPDSTHSRSLMPLLRGDTQTHRDWAIYGYWGTSVNITDGHYTYLLPGEEGGTAYTYSTMMMNPHRWFVPVEVPKEITSGRFLPYTNAPVWRYPAPAYRRHETPLLFDVQNDPNQEENLAGQGLAEEGRMHELLREALLQLKAPEDLLKRLRFD